MKRYTFARPTASKPKANTKTRGAKSAPIPTRRQKGGDALGGRVYTFAVNDRWECRYGCTPTVVRLWQHLADGGDRQHAWNCPYWHNEGKQLTPF